MVRDKELRLTKRLEIELFGSSQVPDFSILWFAYLTTTISLNEGGVVKISGGSIL